MTRLKWAAVLCMVLAGASAQAETGKPRNILEWIFGQKQAEAPTSIAPPQQQAAPLAPRARATEIVRPAKAQKADGRGERKASIRRPKASAGAPGPIDPAPRTAASGAYSGPFRGGGNNAYCVRSCDGFFFPINFEGAQGADRYDSACQASCPGAETQVFFMKRGGDIRYSASARGTPYSALENALKYRKERDPACTCKSQEQRWASVLAPVEATMKAGKSDILVTEETSQKIAQGEDPAAIAKAVERRADAEKAGGTRPDVASDRRASAIRSAFGERIAPASRFIRIDPEPTGALGEADRPVPVDAPMPPARPRDETAKPAGKPMAALALPRPSASAPVSRAPGPAAPPQRNPFATKAADAERVDRDGLRQTLARLVAANQR